jgi:glycosyltransferase involved in cell wall biosynthesis
MNRPVILCFVAYYLPGYRFGGPVRTIANVVDQLGDEFDIRIVTRDRDVLDINAYPDVSIDAWNTVGKAQVFYASKKTLHLRGVSKFLSETPHDVLYLNSFFAFVFTGLPLLARRLGMAPCTPCLIAPRGEFSAGALALKSTKKHVYILLVKTIGLYQNLIWQASSVYEKADIIRAIGSIASLVYVAPDLTPALTNELNTSIIRSPGPLRLIFLSRISPMKNLDFLLRVLARVSAIVELAIYGPQEDSLYWQQCKGLIDLLPDNINVTVGDQVLQELVRDVFAAHDVFVFPTHGENFGHVIFESLTVGTSVLVSDRTPWQQDVQGGLGVLPLVEALWVDAISTLTKLDHRALAQRRRAALEYASIYAADNKPLEQNRQLFRLALCEN